MFGFVPKRIMHRAQSVVNQLVPCVPTIVGRQKFATWLIGPKSRSLIRATQSLPIIENKYSTNVNQEQFLNGTSASYIEDMYNAWLADPKSVNVSWDTFFKNCDAGAQPGAAYQAPPSLSPPGKNEVLLSSILPAVQSTTAIGGVFSEKMIDDHLAVQAIIRSYQVRGHFVSQIDPLGFTNADLVNARKKGRPHDVVLRQHSIVLIRGHHIARLDPLNLSKVDQDDRLPQEILYGCYPPFGK
ncbi:hypothetical protein AGLY_006215 [Aphis glycines]|uniref:2-oxoglutarate dehydrogenase, mitochondrial n=1 Tax=Aphis glycines TaxID=307491 RepID=A0A6G0TQZ6_APHGL|nr:hypothetical protein AGLY_006215 [Aphis glycines]